MAYVAVAVAGGNGNASSPQVGQNLTQGTVVHVYCTPNTGYKADTPTATGITFNNPGTNHYTFIMPASNVQVVCRFSKVNYVIWTQVNPQAGGTLTADKNNANYGDTVQLTLTTSTGYQFTGWTKTPSTLSIGNDLKFTMPAEDVTVKANFTKISYTVTVNAGSNGSATTDKATANYGDTVTITCSPNTGYKANTPTANAGVTFTSAGANKWTFTMPTSNVTVSCTFSKIDYTITTAASPAAGGSLAVSKNPANYGDNITCTPTANSGYQFSSYTTSPTVAVSQNRFVMPASAITVTANFTKISYNVTVNAGTGGTATGSAATGQLGDTITITCTPATGYKANTPTASGITFTSAGTNKWSFTMPAAAVTVSCTFSKVAYNVTVSAGAGGSATASKSSANYQDTITITASPNTGYQANTPTASGITFSSAGTNKWTFTMPAAAVTVSITFSLISYTITKSTSPSGAGTVTTGANSATMGTEVTVSQTPATGYYFNGWTLTPNTLSISSGKFTMPASNVTIQANYMKRSTGSLSSTSLTGGGTVTLTIVPDKTTYSHKYKLSFGTGMETSNTTVAAGTTSVSISVPLNWSAQIPSATSKTGGTLTLETYNGSTLIGTYTIGNLTYNVPASVVPSVGTITTSIARTIGGTTYANVGDYYVQSKCGVRVQTTASGAQSSTISSIQVSLSGYTANAYKTNVSTASVDWTSGLLTNAGTCTITVKATDSRGRTATKTQNINVTAYSKPSGTLSVWRVDANGDNDPLGTYAKYSLTKAYTAVGSNSFGWALTSQNTSATNPADTGNLLPNNRQTFDELSEYTIALTLADRFETVTIYTKLPTAQFMIFCNQDGDRLGLMQATNTSRSKNGKAGTIEISGNHQIYVGDEKAEDYFTPELVKKWSANRVHYNTAAISGNKQGFSFTINSANYLWGTFMVHTRYSIHALAFSTDGNGTIAADTNKVYTQSAETLTITINGRTITVTSNSVWNHFDIDGVSSQAAGDFNFTTIMAS